MKSKQSMTVAEYKALTGRKVKRRTGEFDSEHERIWHEQARVVFLAAGELMDFVTIQEEFLTMRYHPVRLSIPGGHYSPDFLIVTRSLRLGFRYWFIEVKPGDRVSKTGKVVKPGKNRRDARSKLRAAAEVYPFWKFVEARLASTKDPLNWELELI